MKKKMSYKKKVSITLAIITPLIVLSILWGILIGFIKYQSIDPILPKDEVQPVHLGTTLLDFRKLGINPSEVKPFEDGLRTNHQSGEYEWWYFDAHLKDGSNIIITFYTKDYTNPATNMMPYFSINYTTAKGKKLAEEGHFSPQEVLFEKNNCYIKMQDNLCYRRNENYYIKVKTKSLSVDLTLSPTLKAWRAGTGHIYFGSEQKDYFAWLSAVPSGKISGSISLKGRSIAVEGIGYHDHIWGNCAIASLLKQWWSSHVQFGDYSAIALIVKTKNKFGGIEIPIFRVADSKTVIADSTKEGASLSLLETKALRLSPCKYPREIAQEINYNYLYNTTNINLIVSNNQLLTSQSLLTKPNNSTIKIFLTHQAGIYPWHNRFLANAQLEIQQGNTHFKRTKGIGTQAKIEFD